MKPHYVTAYEAHVRSIVASLPLDEAMAEAVGGDFLRFGLLERCVLEQSNLDDGAYVVDVGCGSGRLAFALRDKSNLRYLGIDVVEPLLEYARKICQRDDWSFVQTAGLNIPERGEVADLVCFFSIFTHLRHEESFAYLQEALRVVRPGGRIIFSFLDFSIADHWSHFEAAVRDLGSNGPIVTYMEPSGIAAWAVRLNCKLLRVFDDSAPFINVEEYLGSVEGLPSISRLGQSVAIYEKALS